MKTSIAFLVGTWLSTTIWTAFSTDTNVVNLIKGIPSSAICPDTICPDDSFVRRDDAGHCGCAATGPGSSCDFLRCSSGPPIRQPVTGHCLCPFPHPIIIHPQPTCVDTACPLGGTAFYNTTLNSCACPKPPCIANCHDGYRTGFDSTTGACTCIKEPLCRPRVVFCIDELLYGFNEATLTCGCFPSVAEIPPIPAPRQETFKACDIFCKEGTRLDTTTCTCMPIKACGIFCKDGFMLDTETCTCVPIVPIKPCDIFCKEGTKLDTATCTCKPTIACGIFCKDGFKLDTKTCTCIPVKPCDILCKTGTTLDTKTCTCVPVKPCAILCKTGTTLDTRTCTCVPSNSSSLPKPAGNCATFAPCPDGQFAGFAPFTLECGCINCDALHCPDSQPPKFDAASQKCYCEGVPGECFDLECPPPGQQLVFQQVQNPDGTVGETCACKSKL